jgi:hypothetical protein
MAKRCPRFVDDPYISSKKFLDLRKGKIFQEEGKEKFNQMLATDSRHAFRVVCDEFQHNFVFKTCGQIIRVLNLI